jgi:hypothetical protein
MDFALGCVEPLDDRVRKARELVKRSDDQFTRNGPNLIERYVKGDLNIACIFVGVGRRHYGVVLKACPNATKFDPTPSGCASDHNELRRGRDSDQAPVLPQYVEIVESDEHGVIPSTPRFQIFDECLISSGKPLYRFTSRVFPMEELIAAGANGKTSIFWCRMAVALGEGVYENVQAAADCVNDEPNLGVNDGRRQLNIAKANNLLAHLRAKFFGETIRGVLTPGYEPPLQRIELGFGPVNIGLSV